jgi:hypothetical protein
MYMDQIEMAGSKRTAAETKPKPIGDIHGVFFKSRRAPTNTSGRLFEVFGTFGCAFCGFGDGDSPILIISACVISLFQSGI